MKVFCLNKHKKKQEKIIKRHPDAIDILAVPKVNACLFILMKSRQNSNLFSIGHIAPSDVNRESYATLFSTFTSGEDLDVVFFGASPRDTNLLMSRAKQYDCNIATLRIIPFMFNTEEFTLNVEPKSVYFYYIPSSDQLITYADDFIPIKEAAIHMAMNVFNPPSQPIVFNQLSNIVNEEITTYALKSADNFAERLPLLTAKFLLVYPQAIRYQYQECPDNLASDIEGKKLMAMQEKFDFQTEDIVNKLQVTETASATKTPIVINPGRIRGTSFGDGEKKNSPETGDNQQMDERDSFAKKG